MFGTILALISDDFYINPSIMRYSKYFFKKLAFFLLFFSSANVFATVHIVEATEAAFNPKDISIELGDTVRFEWIEGNHAVASGENGINDEVFIAFPVNNSLPSYDLILDAPGFYPYFCAFHLDEEQTGSITVLGPEVEDCEEMFFSEYIEGSSNNKALELYNPTEQDISLSNYSIKRYNNGNTEASTEVPLEGTVKAGSVFLIVHAEAESELLNQSNLINSNIVNFNGNDALELYNGNLLIDVFGQVGEDPGDGWTIGDGLTEEATLVRKSSVTAGTTDWNIGITQWDDYDQNDFTFVGAHENTVCFTSDFSGCDQLFISEYVEGSSSNKAIEIYNPKAIAVSLDGYFLERFSNGSNDPSFIETLSGTIEPFETFVIANASADAEIAAVADVNSEFAIFDGNDAIALKFNDEIIDVVGIIGDNPGEFWQAGDGNTAENSLKRKPNVDAGSTDWAVSSSQWIALGADNFEDLGSHQSACGSVPPSIGFENATASFNESDADYEFSIIGKNLIECHDFKVVISGTATQNEDYTVTSFDQDTLSLFICPEDPQIKLVLNFIEDEISEISENIVFEIIDAVPGLALEIDEFTVTIKDDELPVGTIGEVAAINAEGVAVNLDQTYQIKGIVYGPNFFTTGLQFALLDETGGIAIYSVAEDFGYIPQEGDELLVSGVIDQFRGLVEIVPFELEVLSTGNTLKNPTVVNALDENSELDLVKLECVQLVNPADWTNEGSGFNVEITNGQNTFTMRIDDQVDLFGESAPDGSFDVIGIGWQFASTTEAPFTDGYQIYPRSKNDIIVKDVVANFSGTNEDLTYTFTATEEGADSYSWNFGDGNSATGQSVEHTFAGNGTYNVILTVIKGGCTASSNQSYVIEDTGIKDFYTAISIYPNPTKGMINISGDFNFNSITILDINGKKIIEKIIPETQNTQIEIASLPNGMYFLQLISKEGMIIEKIKKF